MSELESLSRKIESIITARVRPALEGHGGSIELLEVTPDKWVKVRLQGACAGCPGAQYTLTEIVEAAIREECPDIAGVTAVQAVSDGLLEQALKIIRKDRSSDKRG